MREFAPHSCSFLRLLTPSFSSTKTRSWDLPPTTLLLLPLAIGLLRTLPFLWTYWLVPPEGQMVLNASYMPPDVLSYHAFVRQSAEYSSVCLSNPYTLDAHPGRYILLFHSLLGSLSQLTGISAAWMWELSRFPLLGAFLLTLWWFLKPILPERRDRVWACLLVGLSGGVEGFIKPLASFLPSFFSESFTQATWHLYGWNTFEVAGNPMWIMGLTLLLVTLKPLLQPDGLRTLRDQLQTSVGFFLLFFVHPYSGLMPLAIAGAIIVADIVFRRQLDMDKHLPTLRALFVPFVLIALISLWQSQDPVYQATAGGVFGSLQLAVFWYPLTFGVVGVMALRGAQQWTQELHPYRFSLLAWIAAVMFMHTSPVLNGYHFVMYLHLPLCILAAPALRPFLESLRVTSASETKWRARTALCATLVLTFGSCLLVSWEATADIRRNNLRPAEYQQIVRHLEQLPAGRVFANEEIGAIVPATTPHRVWVGHWFLTRNYQEKRDLFAEVTADERRADDLLQLLDDQNIDYVILPKSQSDWVAKRLAGRFTARVTFTSQTLFVLRDWHMHDAPKL